MADKHVVVQGATCQCKFSESPQTDVLKVKTQTKHYANESDAEKKLIATNKDIGQTLEQNTFGKCKLQPSASGFLPCIVMIIMWENYYKKITYQENQGNPLLEDSVATCPIGGPGCISIKDHGQKAEVTQQNQDNANDTTMALLYPFGSLKKEQEQILQLSNLD